MAECDGTVGVNNNELYPNLLSGLIISVIYSSCIISQQNIFVGYKTGLYTNNAQVCQNGYFHRDLYFAG